MTGNVLLGASFAAALASASCFAAGKRGQGKKFLLCAFVGVFLASCLLLYLILADRFDFAYVVGYSSSALPTVYKISAFWAGQQGSFLLWLLIHAAAGCVLANRAETSSQSLAVYMLLQAAVAVMVLTKSPFDAAEVAAADGVGLNPLLQDPWMAVHPPIIFFGYALLAVPFALSIGALAKNPASADWLGAARKWTLAAWAFLGAGIFIGGYWAYKVLGWGGYWGWDPVENSSLVPWLMATALLHLIKISFARKAVMPVAHLAAIFSYSFVIYGTFLTRSGILGDFSVHSFGESNVGLTISVLNAIILLGGLFFLAAKAKRLPQGTMYEAYMSREFLVLLGMLFVVFAAAIIFIGMSMPLLTKLANNPAAVDSSFYLRTTMPLAVFIAATMTVSAPTLYGKQKSITKNPFVFAPFFIGAGVAAYVGVGEILPVILAGVALTEIAASIVALKKGGLTLGGMTAHVGVGLSLFAMVVAGSGSQTVAHDFAVGEHAEILGRDIVYNGQEFATDGAKKYYVFAVDGRETKALTKLRKNGEDAAREPAIDKTASGDVYIAPSPLTAEREEIILKRNEIFYAGDVAYLLNGTIIEENIALAEISAMNADTTEEVRPFITLTDSGGTSEPVSFWNGEKRMRLTGISGDGLRIRLELLSSAEAEKNLPVTAQISVKPFIWLLWLGAALVVLGTFTAIKK